MILSSPLSPRLFHTARSELTISVALVFQYDRGPRLRLVWLRANAPLRTDAGIQSTHWPCIVCAEPSDSESSATAERCWQYESVRGEGSVWFELCLNLTKSGNSGKEKCGCCLCPRWQNAWIHYASSWTDLLSKRLYSPSFRSKQKYTKMKIITLHGQNY